MIVFVSLSVRDGVIVNVGKGVFVRDAVSEAVLV